MPFHRALVPLAFCGLLACGGRSGPVVAPADAPAQTVAAPLETGPTAAEPRAHARPQRALRLRPILDLLPADRGLIFHLTWRVLSASDLFLAHRDTFLKSIEARLGKVRDLCGFDPSLALESITLAISTETLQSSPEPMVAITSALIREQVEACIGKLGGKVEASSYELGGTKMNALWVSDNTVLLDASTSAVQMQAALDKGRVSDQASTMEFLRLTDSHAAIWGGGALPPSLGNMAGGMALPLGLHFNVNAWSGIEAALGLGFATAEEAGATLGILRMGIQTVQSSIPEVDWTQALTFEQRGSNIDVSVVLSADAVRALLAR